MPTAKKTKSGSWRCQVFSHYDDEGKMHQKSFTVKDPTLKGKKMCEKMALEWQLTKKEAVAPTLGKAIDIYIDSVRNTLSPTTVRSYESIGNRLQGLKNQRLSSITKLKLQRWANDRLNEVKPKTLKNEYGFLCSVYKMFDCEIPKIKLPKKEPNRYLVPSDEDVQKILDYTKEVYPELHVACLLAAFGTLRRGEICALTSKDVFGDYILVRRSTVELKGELIEKSTKTYHSTRTVILPEKVMEIIKKRKGKIVDLTPAALTMSFVRTRTALGMPEYRFHDLRSYSASRMAAIGIPRKYIEERGGWKPGSSVLDSVYIRAFTDSTKQFSKETNDYFDKFKY